MSSSRASPSSKVKAVPGRPWLFDGGSDVGRERAHNEDAILVDGERKLVVLADGMGGYQAGEVASQLAVDVVRDDSSNMDISEAELGRIDPDTGISVAMRQLRGAIEKANNRICSVARGREEQIGRAHV